MPNIEGGKTTIKTRILWNKGPLGIATILTKTDHIGLLVNGPRVSIGKLQPKALTEPFVHAQPRRVVEGIGIQGPLANFSKVRIAALTSI